MSEQNGDMCGGVVSESEFSKDPWLYMMAYVMPDEWFEKYVQLKNDGKDKEAKEVFDEYARSVI